MPVVVLASDGVVVVFVVVASRRRIVAAAVPTLTLQRLVLPTEGSISAISSAVAAVPNSLRRLRRRR